jgi:hypothetical protein
MTLNVTTAIDRAEQIVALADRRHRQQGKLVASLFDQASPPSHEHPFDSSSGSRKEIIMTEADKEGASEFFFIIDLIKR